MSNIIDIISRTRKLFPYLTIILFYFIIINLEAILDESKRGLRKSRDKDSQTLNDTKLNINQSTNNHSKRISIPVLPFDKD